MTTPRPFRFGVRATNAVDARAWVALARNAESLGYSILTMPDHFDDQLAPVPALMAAAAATETLRVGALVWDNDYRHPIVLAKELATIDVLSGGRLEIGLGAGWLASDYQKSGIAYDSNKVRVDRFEEGLSVIKDRSAQPGAVIIQIDVRVLRSLVATAQQQHHTSARQGVVHPVAWPRINAQFPHALATELVVAKVALLDAGDAPCHRNLGLTVA